VKTAVDRLKQPEAAFQAAVIDLARRSRWRVAHFRKVRTVDRQGRPRWRTPVAADGAGFPDLVLARSGRLIFAELKSETGSVDPEQRVWRERLEELQLAAEGAVLYRVWRPRDWPAIEEALR
jgi:microcompartment protein CcmK/EutM